MKMQKRVLAWVLSFCLLALNMSVAAYAAADFDSHWAKDSIERVMEEGWLRGGATENYRPNDIITRAEFIDMINKMMGFTGSADLSEFTDMSPGDWYYETFSIALANQYIFGTGGGKLDPNGSLTRTQAFAIFARVAELNVNAVNSAIANGIQDWQTVPDWGKNAVLAAIAEGLVAGTGNGNISGDRPLTRAESAVLLVNKNDGVKSYAFAGNYTVSNASSIVILGDNITLTIAAGAEIPEITIRSAASNSKVIISQGAAIGTFTVSSGSSGTQVSMAEGSSVGTANLNGPVEVTGGGVIENANITSEGVWIETQPENTNADEGITVNIGVKESDSVGEVATPDGEQGQAGQEVSSDHPAIRPPARGGGSRPTGPTTPTGPTAPTDPTDPTDPTGPTGPTDSGVLEGDYTIRSTTDPVTALEAGEAMLYRGDNDVYQIYFRNAGEAMSSSSLTDQNLIEILVALTENNVGIAPNKVTFGSGKLTGFEIVTSDGLIDLKGFELTGIDVAVSGVMFELELPGSKTEFTLKGAAMVQFIGVEALAIALGLEDILDSADDKAENADEDMDNEALHILLIEPAKEALGKNEDNVEASDDDAAENDTSIVLEQSGNEAEITLTNAVLAALEASSGFEDLTTGLKVRISPSGVLELLDDNLKTHGKVEFRVVDAESRERYGIEVVITD